MRDGASFDVLVVGSGAAGLAAAVSAERAGARVGLATKTTLQACNSAKAQGGIQAAFGEDDSPEIHAEDVMRSSHDTADPRLVEVLTSEAPSAIHWLEELRRRVHALERRLPARALRRRDPQAAAPGRRPHGPRDHEVAARDVRGGRRGRAAAPRPARARAVGRRAGRRPSRRRKAPCDGRGGRARARGRRSLLRRGGDARRALDEPSERDRRGDADRPRRRRGGARPRRAPVPPERRRVAVDDAGLLDPGDDARVRRRAAERGRRGVHRLARPARRRLAGDLRRGRGRGGESSPPDGRPAVWLDTTRIEQEDAEISLPYMLRRYRGAGIDPLAEPIYTYPVLHYQNGGLVIDEHAETTLEGVFACGEIAGGTHGRNRMMGNSLLECAVFGRRAGKAATERARA